MLILYTAVRVAYYEPLGDQKIFSYYADFIISDPDCTYIKYLLSINIYVLYLLVHLIITRFNRNLQSS